ncbi:hypothetical protein OUI_1456 [Helicobacter pylori R036d]|uniref:Uncharacterized protein n=1 Tax=Helicobacter pylori R036d TaxID=1145113 RepID=K2JNZ1_HELPX|nr:hypothetical protein OUI_1456 [Helicobacter pylori R036d]
MEIEHKKISCIIIPYILKKLVFFEIDYSKEKEALLILRALFH